MSDSNSSSGTPTIQRSGDNNSTPTKDHSSIFGLFKAPLPGSRSCKRYLHRLKVLVSPSPEEKRKLLANNHQFHKDICRAVVEDDTAALDVLLSQVDNSEHLRAILNSVDPDANESPLYIAIKLEHVGCVERLLSKGASLSYDCGGDKGTPLQRLVTGPDDPVLASPLLTVLNNKIRELEESERRVKRNLTNEFLSTSDSNINTSTANTPSTSPATSPTGSLNVSQDLGENTSPPNGKRPKRVRDSTQNH